MRLGRLPVWLCVLMFAGCATAQAQAGERGPEVREKVLDNGMLVLVKPDHRAPVVVSQIWYRA